MNMSDSNNLYAQAQAVIEYSRHFSCQEGDRQHLSVYYGFGTALDS